MQREESKVLRFGEGGGVRPNGDIELILMGYTSPISLNIQLYALIIFANCGVMTKNPVGRFGCVDKYYEVSVCR